MSEQWFYTRTADGGWRREALPPGGVPVGAAVAPMPHFALGVDLGKVRDHTAIVLVEAEAVAGPPGVLFRVTHAERVPLGTNYAAATERVLALCAALPKPPDLLIDKTGVGDMVAESLWAARPRCAWWCPVFITGSGRAQLSDVDRTTWHVPKVDLVSVVQVALQNRRFVVADRLPAAGLLQQEMRNFEARYTPSGNVTYGAAADWRVGNHDDLVLATALACWGAAKRIGARVVVG